MNNTEIGDRLQGELCFILCSPTYSFLPEIVIPRLFLYICKTWNKSKQYCFPPWFNNNSETTFKCNFDNLFTHFEQTVIHFMKNNITFCMQCNCERQVSEIMCSTADLTICNIPCVFHGQLYLISLSLALLKEKILPVQDHCILLA